MCYPFLRIFWIIALVLTINQEEMELRNVKEVEPIKIPAPAHDNEKIIEKSNY